MTMPMKNWLTKTIFKQPIQTRKEFIMDYIRKLTYTYTDETQYAEADLESHNVVDAEYTRVMGCEGNADVEALPLPLSGKELDGQDVQKKIDRTLYNGLVRSYKGRQYALTKNSVPLKFDEKVKHNVLSMPYIGNVADGAAIIGPSGMDKNMAVGIAARRYPKAIFHTTPDGSYVQIPVIRTTQLMGGNPSAQFQMFAARLDDILDSGTLHQDMLARGNIGKMCARIISWIQTYHIGCWIIEDCYFSDFFNSSKSFEMIVCILQETGVFLLVTENTDCYRKIVDNLPLVRRVFSSIVDMDDTSRNRMFMEYYF